MTARSASASARTPLAALAGFAAGVTLTVLLALDGRIGAPAGVPPPGDDCGRAMLDDAAGPVALASRPRREARRDDVPADPPRIGADPAAGLRARNLLIPVRGYESARLRSSFDEPRSGGRVHEAMDLLAPRNTPVVAVEDGTVARLFTSDAGGLTIYQFDPSSAYVYYYAHLERYAAGLRDGAAVHRGQVIGYVGTSGNAPANTPHLHFAIYRLTEAKRWWEGVPIDPFDVLR